MPRRRTSHPPTGPAGPAGSAPFDSITPPPVVHLPKFELNLAGHVYVATNIEFHLAPQFTTPPAQTSPPYSLTRHPDHWVLVFAGSDPVILKHSIGLLYVADLLSNPTTLRHAAKLYATHQIRPSKQAGISSITDPATGQTSDLPADAILEEYDLGRDDQDATSRLLETANQCKETLRSPTSSKADKDNARIKLNQIHEFLSLSNPQSPNSRKNVSKVVRRAIDRFYQALLSPPRSPGTDTATLVCWICRQKWQHSQRRLGTENQVKSGHA